jgi:hypothetical protein
MAPGSCIIAGEPAIGTTGVPIGARRRAPREDMAGLKEVGLGPGDQVIGTGRCVPGRKGSSLLSPRPLGVNPVPLRLKPKLE